MFVRLVVALAVLALLAVGCSGTSDEQQIRTALREYVEAIDRGDKRAQCQLFSTHATRRFLAYAHRIQRDPVFRDFPGVDRSRLATSCASAFQVLGFRPKAGRKTALADPRTFDALKQAKITVEGERATVSPMWLALFPHETTVFVNERGRWLFYERP